MTRIGSAHHVLGIPHLLCELGDRQSSVLLGATGSEGREAHHEEVKTRERNEVHGELSEIGVELPGEAEAAGDPTHGGRNKMVQVAD